MRKSVLERFHPLLAGWFRQTFGEPTDVQEQAWQSIKNRDHTLIAAPTGSGKTLAALLPCLDAVVRTKTQKGSSAGRRTGVRIVYITPLKALNNDIYDHLVRFIEQIDRVAAEADEAWPGIRGAVRTGDTTSAQRSAMLRRPPDVLVTTPESLYILLTSEKGKEMLGAVESVIVDEIHDLAPDKRGAHLSLSLERLERLRGSRIQRIGVSATQKPLERVAAFLGGWEEPDGEDGGAAAERTAAGGGEPNFVHPLGFRLRPVTIVESAMAKTMDVTVTMPDHSQPMQTRESVWIPILDRLFSLMTGCRSVLLFVNSRRLCERLCLRLNDHAGYEMARAHHGSMAKERRLEVERMLKAGELRCIVATSSLELGIDVGHVDLVIQLDSPLEAASGIQRIGRAGHAVGSASRGVIVARQRGALAEIAVLSKQIAERDIEPIEIRRDRLDVLSQQTISIIAAEELKAGELHRLISRSDCYRSFPLKRLEAMLEVLAGFYPFVRPLLDWDRDSGMLAKRKNTSIAALTGAGTIPSSSAYPVHHVDSRVHLGELDEEFVQESRVGDVFQLGTNAWMIARMDKDRIYVSEAANRFSEIPFWRNEGIGRSYPLGVKVGAFMEELEGRLGLRYEKRLGNEAPDNGPAGRTAADQTVVDRTGADRRKREADAAAWLGTRYGMDVQSAEELIGFVRSQLSFSELPTHRRIVIEHYRDVTDQTHVILHNPFGRRVNRTWLLAIERQFESLLPYKLYANAKDNGIEFVLPEWDPSWLQSIWHVTPANLEKLLMEAIAGSPLLAIAFRHISETSLLLSRSFTRTPLWQKRLRSEELLREALPYAERFPFLTEAMKECLDDYLDLRNLHEVLEGIGRGDIEIAVRETEYPSPMATQFLADYVNMRIYEGDGLDAAVQMQLMNVSKEMAGRLFGVEALKNAIPYEVLEAERQRLGAADRPVRDEGDLLRLLKWRGDLAADELIRLAGPEAAGWIERLAHAGDAVRIRLNPEGDEELWRWICRDETEMYEAFPRTEASVAFIAGRFAESRLSFTEVELCERYPKLSLQDAKRVVSILLEQNKIEQAPFAVSSEERIWSGRQAAARMLRLSINEARKQVRPAAPVRWCSQIAAKQHALQGTQLRGGEGLLAVLERLQGLFLPLSHWETIILPSRLSDYRKEELDRLCAAGEVIWLGRKEPGDKEGKVAFFLSSARALYEPYLEASRGQEASHPRLFERLRASGASFLTRLSRDTGKMPSETLSELLELAWEGHASNDQFAPLRLLAAKKGKDWAKTGSGLGRWYWTGDLLEDSPPEEAEASGASVDGGDGAVSRPERRNAESPAVYWVRHMLDTYGIVTKELAAAVSPFDWDRLLPVMRKLEEWGTVTRGIFIEGTATMQFTTPDIAAQVRKPAAGEAGKPLTLLSAVDPANPYGLLVDWPDEKGRGFARKPGNFLVLRGDRWLYWVENNGRRIHAFDEDMAFQDEDAAELKALFGLILKRQRLSKLVIERWNGEDVAETAAGDRLREMGAERDRKTLVLWPSLLS